MLDAKPIDQLINQAIKNGVFPGAVISVGDANGELYRNHYGSRSLIPERRPVEAGTMFDLASLTKIVSTSMVVFKFIDAGKLRLDDKIGVFFDVPADKEKITIRHLMTHASGLPPHVMLSDFCANPQDAYAYILGVPLLASPGADVAYSCLGYILLGKICELLGGAPLDKLAAEMVFIPLGLDNTMYNPDVHNGNFAATEYDKERGACLSGVVHDEDARFMGGVAGNAGVFSDIADCAVFAQMLANKGRIGGRACKGVSACGGVGTDASAGCDNNDAFISSNLFEEAIINHTPHCDEARGLGFAVKGAGPVSCGNIFSVGSYGHTGFTGTSVWVDAETTQYVVFLSNRVHPSRENVLLTPFRGVLHDCCATAYRKQG